MNSLDLFSPFQEPFDEHFTEPSLDAREVLEEPIPPLSVRNPTLAERVSGRKDLFKVLSQAGVVERITLRTEAKATLREEGQWGCSLCPTKTFSESSIKQHVRNLHQMKDRCKICKKVLKIYYGIHHALSTHSEHPLVTQALETSTTSPHLHPYFRREILRRTEGEYTNARVVQITSSNRFGCSLCPKISTKHKHDATVHWLRVHRKVKEECTICKKLLAYNRGIIHVKTQHRNDERVRGQLQLLETAHLGESTVPNLPQTTTFAYRPKPLSAGHHYFRSGILQRTEPLPTEARVVPGITQRFACSDCGKGFPSKSGTGTHIAVIHRKIRETCTLCEKTLRYGHGITHVTRQHPTHDSVRPFLENRR